METKVKSTRDAILEQLHESTGTSLCDSGGIFGRHWQRNQKKTWEDFTKEPVRLEAHVYSHGDKPVLELMGYISLASWMENNLEYSQELQDAFEAWVEANDPEGEYYDMSHMESFADEQGQDSWGAKRQVNYTYNYDNDLSQDIQFITFSWTDSEGYESDCALVQVHQGCDARGGMGSPKAYVLKCEYMGDFSISCYGCASHSWDADGTPQDSSDFNIKDYPVHDLVWVPTLEHDLANLAQTDHNTPETQALMRATAKTLERDYFEEFCDALTEHSFVVWKGKCYFVGDEGPEEMYADAYSLMG
jgi:hypothetical protein